MSIFILSSTLILTGIIALDIKLTILGSIVALIYIAKEKRYV